MTRRPASTGSRDLHYYSIESQQPFNHNHTWQMHTCKKHSICLEDY